MGKKNRNKEEKTFVVISSNAAPKPKPMDPTLINAFARGREAGIKVGIEQGEAEGFSKALALYNAWIQDLDQHVKGIGPSKRDDIVKYFSERLNEAIEQGQVPKPD